MSSLARALPFIVTASKPTAFGQLARFISHEKERLQSLLLNHGAILFRGFRIADAADFDQIAKTYTDRPGFDYSGGVSPRTHLCGSVYTSTEWTPVLRIPLHSEMSYTPQCPALLLFHCARPPLLWGSTPLADTRAVYHRIDTTLRKKFTELGVEYVRFYFERDRRIELLNKLAKAHKTWMDVFETHDRSDVERQCGDKGITYSWQADGGIILTTHMPAVRSHPVTGEPVWFNQAHAFNHLPKSIGWLPALLAKTFYPDESKFMHRVYFGDGTPIPRRDIHRLLEGFSDCTVRFPWQRGDVLLIDNFLVAHGRDPYLGPRRVLTAIF